jgi:uncharacterized protein with PIN domain
MPDMGPLHAKYQRKRFKERRVNEKPKCPKCGEPLRKVEDAVYTGSDPPAIFFALPHWKCDKCGIASYDLKKWFNKWGTIRRDFIAKEKEGK